MNAAPKLRILLADDHPILREGLVGLIERQPDMAVVALAADGIEAVDLARKMQPDVAVLDVSMPKLGGAEAAERIRAACPRVRMLALTRHADPAYLRRLFQAGATGYVLKKSAADALVGAIRVVAGGGIYIEPELAGPLVATTFAPRRRRNPSDAGLEPLTAREEEVLRAIAWGSSNKEIAADLGLSIKTVESYKAAASEKLGLRSRNDIVRYAVTRGWLSQDGAPE